MPFNVNAQEVIELPRLDNNKLCYILSVNLIAREEQRIGIGLNTDKTEEQSIGSESVPVTIDRS